MDLTGQPSRIAVDQTTGLVIVARTDLANQRTAFDAVNPTTGAIPPLQANVPGIVCNGLGVSADGAKIYCAVKDELFVRNKNSPPRLYSGREALADSARKSTAGQGLIFSCQFIGNML